MPTLTLTPYISHDATPDAAYRCVGVMGDPVNGWLAPSFAHASDVADVMAAVYGDDADVSIDWHADTVTVRPVDAEPETFSRDAWGYFTVTGHCFTAAHEHRYDYALSGFVCDTCEPDDDADGPVGADYCPQVRA